MHNSHVILILPPKITRFLVAFEEVDGNTGANKMSKDGLMTR